MFPGQIMVSSVLFVISPSLSITWLAIDVCAKISSAYRETSQSPETGTDRDSHSYLRVLSICLCHSQGKTSQKQLVDLSLSYFR